MIYFLAESLTAKDGASRAAADLLNDLLGLHQSLVVVSRTRDAVLDRTNGGPAPRVRWLLLPPTSPPEWRGLGASPRAWAYQVRMLLKYHWRRLRMAAIPRLFPPTLAIHNEFPYPGSPAHRLLHTAPRRMIVVHTSRDQIAYFLRRRKVLTPEIVATELERMHGLLFVSPQIRDEWAETADIAEVRQWVLSNTCREEEAAAVLARDRGELRASLGFPSDAFVAACVGYVHDGKGQDTLVAALPGMVRAAPKLLVVFVGNDTSQWAAQLKARIGDLGMSDHVRFAGLRPDPYAFIRAADLLVHPARAEAQGLVLLEAMLLRTPVLASGVGGIPSVITHGETGWLVPPGDPDALLEGFLTLARDPQLRAALVARAEKEYWSRFNRAEHRRRLCTIVESMLAGS